MAGATLLAHVLALWLMLHMRTGPDEAETAVQPVMLTVVDPPPVPVNVSEGPVPIEVQLSNVIRLERLAPPTLGPTIDLVEPIVEAEAPALAATAIEPGDSDRGMNGTDNQSSGVSGGGDQIRLLQRVVPRYPAVSMQRNEQGVTGVRVKVGANGRVQSARVAKSSGHRSLDNSALEAVRKWRFAPLPPGLPAGMEFETELRFVLYLFQYSRIGPGAADAVYDEQVKAGTPDEMTPGSQEALARFMGEVSAGSYIGESDKATQVEIAKMRAALDKWGETRTIQFTGMAGRSRWLAYPVGPVTNGKRASIEVSWNTFDVQHRNAKSTWLVAVSRDGTVWDARANLAPW